jgi:hypothetical protein
MNPDDLFMRPSIYADRMRRGPGQYDSRPSHGASNADGIAMAQSQRTADAAQLSQQLRPLQETLLGSRAEGTGMVMNEAERAATVQAMLEIIQRPGWAPEEQAAAMEWMRQMGALPPAPSANIEDALFMPPGMR